MASPIRGGNKITYKIFNERFATLLLGTKKGGGTRRDIQRQKEGLFSIERRILVKLVNRHKPTIKAKFPEVNMKDVVDSVEIMFRNAVDTQIRRSPKKLKWENAERSIVSGKTVRSIQDLSSDVRTTLRNNAIKAIALSKREAVQEEAIVSSIIIGGIDPRTEEAGGDIRQEQLEIDKTNGIFRFKKGTGQELSRIAKRKKQGFDVGHTFGPGTANISSFTGSGTHSTAITAFLTPTEKLQLIELRDRSRRIDTKMTLDTRLFNQSGRKIGSLTITIAEFTGDNQQEGGQLRQITADAIKILEKVKADLVELYEASPTILDQYRRGIEDLFLKGKIKKSAFNKRKTYKASAKGKEKVPVYGPSLTSSKDTNRPSQVERAPDLQLVIDLVNRKLHDQIKENMGKGTSKLNLNYRTGRFARSAKVQALLPSREKGAIIAQVKYMRRPYSVFEPGGRLAKPGRDPHRIFGRSIRQILQKEKIAKLRRVKVNLRG